MRLQPHPHCQNNCASSHPNISTKKNKKKSKKKNKKKNKNTSYTGFDETRLPNSRGSGKGTQQQAGNRHKQGSNLGAHPKEK